MRLFIGVWALTLCVVVQAHEVLLSIDEVTNIATAFNGKTFRYHPARLFDKDKIYSLLHYGEWQVSQDANKLIVEVHTGGAPIRLELPQNILDNLLTIFQEVPTHSTCNPQGFDCHCFVHHAHGKSVLDTLTRDGTGYRLADDHADHWSRETTSKKKIKAGNLHPGDVIRIWRKKPSDPITEEHHLALYLGRNLFLSKFNADGPILVTTLRNFSAFYPYPNIEIWRPVDNPQCKALNITLPKTVLKACAVTTCFLSWFLGKN